MTKILDIQQSIISANGNASLAKELFTMLLDDIDVRMQQIESSFRENNIEMLQEHIHKLYGATAYCIVPQLRESAAALDEVVRQKNHTQLQSLVDDVLQEIKQLINDGPAFIEEDWIDIQIED